MQYCPHCMRPAAGAVCPSCGGDVSWTGQKGIDLPVGTVLSGGNGLRAYQIGAARGKGGFGITYIALETNSGRRVAIKEYFPTRCAFRGGNGVDVQAMTGQEEPFRSGMDGFMKEGKMLLSQDDLSCVVHVIDYFQANGTAYLAMEYLDGVPLHTQMTRMGGRIPVNELMPRLALLLRDIGQLHRRGVIHRDISPDNIMWMPDGGLKLLDFGSARSIMESGRSMTVLMKQGFSPIEQYRTRGQGPYTDIYALAATIYYCVTGVIPPSSMERLGEDTLQLPTALGAALTTEQETALLWALSIQPEARPQSMEEFAARLYKEERPQNVYPKPSPPVYSTPQPQPRSEQPPQARPVTERNAAYQYGQSQYTGQSQPAGQGQYTGHGQPAGQGQPAGPGRPKTGGGNKKLPVFIGAAAAAVAAVLIGVFVWMSGDKEGTVEHPVRPSRSAAPVSSRAPASSLTPVAPAGPAHDTGVTDGGYRYEIIDRSHAVITGFEGSGSVGVMPDYVEGNIPITGIADNAFVGASMGEMILLPIRLETIGANAFRGGSDIMYICAYSDVATESSSFSGCSELWFVFIYDENVSGWDLPEGVQLFYEGMETGYGPLADFDRDGDLLVGTTDDDSHVLLDARSWVYTVNLTGCDWVCPGALDNPPYSIELGENTLFPYEVYSSRNTWTAPEGSVADMWLLTCEAADAINDARPSGAARIQPDRDLLRPAIVRADELCTVNDFTRPDGRDGFSVLDDLGVDYGYAGSVRGYDCYSKSEVFGEIPSLTDYYASPLTETQSTRYAGQYYTGIGMAYSETSSGEYVYYVFVTVL